MIKQEFKVGDIISWSTPICTKDYYVIDVWNTEPKQLLITEVERDSGKAYTALQEDCTLKHRPDEVPVSKFERRANTAKELPNYRIPNDG